MPHQPQPVSTPQDFGVNWTRIVATSIHPVKVGILEAHLWIEKPLVTAELSKMLRLSWGVTDFHVRNLRQHGLLDLAVKEAAHPFDWSSLLEFYIHPLKVAIIEAIARMGRPLSSAELNRLFDPSPYSLGALSYHVRKLADQGILTQAHTREVRGSVETFYTLASW